MRNKIISYLQMCQQENTSSLQRGMTYAHKGSYSILLMSLTKNAPYKDQSLDEGKILIYEGHNAQRSHSSADPKLLDQPEFLDNRKLTENGKFHKAAQAHQKDKTNPMLVRVYEKIKPGIWSDNGFFYLVDSYRVNQGGRMVFKFKLEATDDLNNPSDKPMLPENSRIIPSAIKYEVWKRDGGACRECGAKNELHFDHIIPFSKGGTSLKAENIQLLCARHNLGKSAKII